MSEVVAESRADPFGLVGTIVDGRYRIERLAGQGGFGVVYRAHHLGFDSAIALKVLRLPAQGSEARRRARIAGFQREGRMLFELSLLHPAIVRAFETGTLIGSDGSPAPYLALEWLEGLSLEGELCQRRVDGAPPFTLREVLTLLSEPAAGLARAHARGIAHRDIKPANLFVTERDHEQHVKILDFGIAKLVREAAEPDEHSTAPFAATGSFTPLYAAPEQWVTSLGPTGAWTDVHALALVCVELLTGRPALGDRAGSLEMACTDPQLRPTPASRGVRLPDAVEAVFARALALAPRARFEDANGFWQALCRAADWSPNETPAFVPMRARVRHGLELATHSTGPLGASSRALAGASTTAGTASRSAVIESPRSKASRFQKGIVAFASLVAASSALGLRSAKHDHVAGHRRHMESSVSPSPTPAEARLFPSNGQVASATAALPTPAARSARSAAVRTTELAPARKARSLAVALTSRASAAEPAGAALPDELNPLPTAPLNLDDPALVVRK